MEKKGLGFQSDEADYEKELCQEIEGLVLGENKLNIDKLVYHEKGLEKNVFVEKYHEKDVKVGFGDDGVKEGFDSDVGFGEKDEKVDFDSDVGSDKEDLIEGFYGDEGFDTDGVEEGFKGFEKENAKDCFNGDVGFDREGFEKSFYGDVGSDEGAAKEGLSGEKGEGFSEEGGKEGFNSAKSEWFGEDGEKDGVSGVKSEWGYDGNNSYSGRERSEGGVEGFDREDGREGFYDDVGFGGGVREGYNGGEKSWGYNGNNNHPVRPDAEDCQYFMRFGACKYGPTCKFNHPLKRRNQAAKEKEDYSLRPGKVECKYQTTPGGCKYGTGCKFNHSNVKISSIPAIEFNFLGLPIRQGETECPYYMRNGSCKYGSSCRFNHPQPTDVGHEVPTSRYNVNGGNVTSYAKPQTNMSSWSSSRNAVKGGGSMSSYSPTARVPNHNVEWNSYQAPMYPATERRLPNPPAFTLNNHENNLYTNNKMPMTVEEFPERPGEPECSYFIKTGDCKYRSGCKFHHPKDRTPSSAVCALSDKGLPLRPDQPVCSYYTRYGLCKYGPACRYDHPADYDNSASSPFSGQNSLLPASARW